MVGSFLQRLALTTVAILLSAACVAAPANAATGTGKKVALVVGIQQYDAPRLRLGNSARDAEALGKLLKNIGFDVRMLLDPSEKEFRTTLKAFGDDLDKADVGLFFYAGHAMQMVQPGEVTPSNLLLPRDFDVPDIRGVERSRFVQAHTLAMDDVVKLLHEKARIGLVFLDACRDNPFAKEELQMAASQAQQQSNAVVASRSVVSRGLSAATPFRSANPTGLRRAVTPRKGPQGMVIAYATSPGDIAEDGAGKHSPFTSALLKYIAKPGRLIDQVLRDVATEVNVTTQGLQRPWVSSSLLGGDFYIVPPGLGVGTPLTVPAVPRISPPGTAPSAKQTTPSKRRATTRARASTSAQKRSASVSKRASPPRAQRSRSSGRSGGGSSLPPALGMGVGAGL